MASPRDKHSDEAAAGQAAAPAPDARPRSDEGAPPPHGDPLGGAVPPGGAESEPPAGEDGAPLDSGHAPPHGDPLAGAVPGGDGRTEPGTRHGAGEAPAEDAQQRAQEYLALAQRTQADFENYRKRMTREAAAAVDRGVMKLAKELLPALDHLERALQSAEEHEGAAEWVKGIRLVQDEFQSALKRVGIEPFSPEGEPFDPAQHEAMAQRPEEDAESGTVVEVYQQGYKLNDALLRPARVVVAA